MPVEWFIIGQIASERVNGCLGSTKATSDHPVGKLLPPATAAAGGHSPAERDDIEQESFTTAFRGREDVSHPVGKAVMGIRQGTGASQSAQLAACPYAGTYPALYIGTDLLD
jgi:hypothetical protein